MNILDRYFELSDVAGTNEAAFWELMGLFAENAMLHPAGGDEVIGKEAIAKFFDGFFKKNVVLKHVWNTKTTEKGLQTSWAVAGQRISGEVFALQGVDIAKLNDNGQIQFLEVRFDNKK